MSKKSTESRSARGAQAREMRAASRKQRRSQTSHTQRQKDKNGEERRHMNKETPPVPVRNAEYWQVQQECKTPLQTSAPKPAPRKKKRLVGWGALMLLVILAAVGILAFMTVQRQEEERAQSLSAAQAAAAQASSVAQEETLAPRDPDLWSLLLANTTHPLPEGYAPELASVGYDFRNIEQFVDQRIQEPLLDMLAAAEEDGVYLQVRSAYRSHENQTILFESMKQDYIAQGYTEEEAYAATKRWRNVPGTSEHETGLAADIVAVGYGGSLDESLEETEEAKWLYENAADYGFILRYPKDKTDITGTSFEPWHYRYVGVEDARKIMDAGICLEEYLGMVD